MTDILENLPIVSLTLVTFSNIHTPNLTRRSNTHRFFSDYENLRRIHPLSYAAVSGTMGSFSVVYGKSIGMLFANTFGEKQNEFAHPYLYVSILCIIISVISQTHFLALGLKYFDALFIVPVFQCFFITLSILGGAIYWKETSGFNGTQWFVFVLGVIVVRDFFFSLSLFFFF